MTLVQLEYIVAVDTYRSFVIAAEKCFVTQPTLSMQVQKLEDILGVKIFDRSRQPVSPTEVGIQILAQARTILQESAKIQEIINSQQKEVSGELKIGVIPTVAPYLLPQLLAVMLDKYPDIKLLIWEHTTEEIIQHLKTGILDCGIMATPINDVQIVETPLYYESYVGYISKSSNLSKKKSVDPADLSEESIWLLDNEHCMHHQVVNICNSSRSNRKKTITYNSGSVETLIRMVDLNGGATLLPELAISKFTTTQAARVRYFKSPEPVREISLVTHKNFIKRRMLNALEEEIASIIPKGMKQKKKKEVIDL